MRRLIIAKHYVVSENSSNKNNQRDALPFRGSFLIYQTIDNTYYTYYRIIQTSTHGRSKMLIVVLLIGAGVAMYMLVTNPSKKQVYLAVGAFGVAVLLTFI